MFFAKGDFEMKNAINFFETLLLFFRDEEPKFYSFFFFGFLQRWNDGMQRDITMERWNERTWNNCIMG